MFDGDVDTYLNSYPRANKKTFFCARMLINLLAKLLRYLRLDNLISKWQASLKQLFST